MKTRLFFFGLVAMGLSFTACDDKNTEPVETAYDLADAGKGGILYDKFWSVEAGFDQNDANLATLNAKSDFFRCKQCHGWDLLGAGGSYINRAPKTSRPSVSSLNLFQLAKSKTPQELFDAMKKTTDRRDISYDLTTYDPATNSAEGDKMPDYTQLLSDAQLWDLVKFLKEGALDVSKLYDATYTGTYPTGTASYANVGRDGNAATGATFYANTCVACHGANGTQILVEDMTVGKFTRSKPNEVHHKVKFGQLGSSPSMVGEFTISETEMKDLYKALSDETTFPD